MVRFCKRERVFVIVDVFIVCRGRCIGGADFSPAGAAIGPGGRSRLSGISDWPGAGNNSAAADAAACPPGITANQERVEAGECQPAEPGYPRDRSEGFRVLELACRRLDAGAIVEAWL